MIFYVGNTDYEWFKFLRARSPEDVNFWQPGGKLGFHAISRGAPFLMKLRSPINKIAGVGFFSTHSKLPIDFAWEVFRERNGVESIDLLKRKINSLRGSDNSLDKNPVIGCLILSQPVFFWDEDWLSTPPDWAPNIQSGRKYDTMTSYGMELWKQTEALLSKYRLPNQSGERSGQMDIFDEDPQRYGVPYLMCPRLGQGAFRVIITDIYSRKCAISGERTLPVLEAAHIKPYEKSGPHRESNGILLRADLHLLFDKGYLTVTNQYKVEVSKRIREEFENGRDYYRYHGIELAVLPPRMNNRPSPDFLDWHNNNVYKG